MKRVHHKNANQILGAASKAASTQGYPLRRRTGVPHEKEEVESSVKRA